MGKKAAKWFIAHPMESLIIMGLCLMVLMPILVSMPQGICTGLASFGGVLMVILMFWSTWKERKEKRKLQNMTKSDMQEAWREYVNVVNTTVPKQNLDDSWIETFHNLMYSVAGNSYYLKRKLNDFDIAAVLIYSLTWEQKKDEDIRIAFECAKKVMRHPKVYSRYIGLGGKMELEVEEPLLKTKENPFDEEISEEMGISMIRRYLKRKSVSGVVQLSDFLHTLYTTSE